MSRSPIVACCVTALLLTAAGTRTANAADASQQKLTREAVLRATATKVIAPAYTDLDTRCRALSAAVNKFVQKPDAGTLQNARERWRDAFLSAQRISCFKLGPVVDEGHVTAFYFSMIRPASIERFVSGKEPMTAAKVEELGASVKGLRAIEYLMTKPSPEAAFEALKSGERRRLYLQLLASDVAQHAEKLAKQWQPPLSPSAGKFVAGSQESINALVNQLASSVEDLTERQVRSLIAPENQTEQIVVEGQMVARMEGFQRIVCEENGLVDLLTSLGSPAGERLKPQIEGALAKLKEIEAESGAKRQEMAPGAYDACRQVELLIKVDAASALGVTLTFSSIDGD